MYKAADEVLQLPRAIATARIHAPSRLAPLSLTVGLSAALAVPGQAKAAAPCEYLAAEDAYTAALEIGISDEDRVKMTIAGLTGSVECPESAETRDNVAIVLLNAALQLTEGDSPEAGAKLLCEAVAAVQEYQDKRVKTGSPLNPTVQSRFATLQSYPSVKRACIPAVPPVQTQARPTRPFERTEVRAGVGLLVIGAVGFAVSGGLSKLVLDKEDQRKNLTPESCNVPNFCSDLKHAGEQLEVAQYVSYGLASAVLVTGIVMLAVGLSKDRKNASRVGQRATFAGTSLSLRF